MRIGYLKIIPLILGLLTLFTFNLAAATNKERVGDGRWQGGEREELSIQAKRQRRGKPEDKKERWDKLSEKSPHELLDAVVGKLEERHSNFLQNGEKKHRELLARLEKRLQFNDKLSDEEKGKVLQRLQQRYQEIKEFHQARHQETVKFLEDLRNAEELTRERIRKEFRKHLQEQRKQFRERQQKD